MNSKALNTRKKILDASHKDKSRNRKHYHYHHNGPSNGYGAEIERLLRIEELENNDLKAQRVLKEESLEFARTVRLIRLIIEELSRYEKEHEHLSWQLQNK